MTIRETMERAGFDDAACAVPMIKADLREAFLSFADWPLGSHCGEECERLIQISGSLLAAADPAARPQIWVGVVAAMAVICVG